MKIRLGFGIATNVFADILLIDEIIGVGDAQFLEKAKARMSRFVHQAEVVVLSTHDTHIAKELCNKALWLEQGSVTQFGGLEEVLADYRVRNGGMS